MFIIHNWEQVLNDYTLTRLVNMYCLKGGEEEYKKKKNILKLRTDHLTV